MRMRRVLFAMDHCGDEHAAVNSADCNAPCCGWFVYLCAAIIEQPLAIDSLHVVSFCANARMHMAHADENANAIR